MIRILIADDHAIVREGLRTLINTEADMQLVGEAANGRDAVALYGQLQPDVVLLDVVMPHLNGIEASRDIRRADSAARILVLTSFANEDLVIPAIEAGASGYLLKDTSPEQLLQSIRDIHADKPVLHPHITQRLIQKVRQTPQPAPIALTDREVIVLRLVAQGLSNRDIAQQLTLSELTIQTHVRNILDKLALDNRTQAALYALRNGIAAL